MRRFVTSFFIVMSLLFPVAATAFEVPLLTWERGRVQQVVLGGGSTSAKWVLTLEGNGISPMEFSSSQPNDAGYVVYSLEIPKDLPLGAYSVYTSAPGAPKSVVAGVAMVEIQARTATNSLIDLTQIIGILVFLTALFSTLRSAQYSRIRYPLSQPISSEAETHSFPGNFSERLTQAPARIRSTTLGNLRQSLFTYLIIREGEALYRLNKVAYSFLPFAGILVGTIAGIEVQKNGGLAQTGLGIFMAISILSVIDPLSGLFATSAFWAVEVFLGHVTSVRDLLVVISTGLALIAPVLVATLFAHGLQEDLKNSKAKQYGTWVEIILSSFAGSLLFYFGNLLASSILYINTSARTVHLEQVGIIASVIALKKLYEFEILKRDRTFMAPEFHIVRVSSPISAIMTNIAIFAFVYIWTESASKSAEVSILFSIPFYLVFIKFSEISKFPRLKRSVLVEPVLMAAIAFVLFKQISFKPLLNDQMAILLLFMTAIPGIVHAIYSAICSSNEKEGIIRV